MATGAKGRPVPQSSGGFSNYSADTSVDMGADPKSDSMAQFLIAFFMVVILLILPLEAWMYIEINSALIRVDKALKRLEK